MSKPAIIITDAKIAQALEEGRSIESATAILLDAFDFKSGQSVAILDDTAYGMDGQRGIVKGSTANKAGFVDVQLPNRMILPIPANLLLPL